MEFDISAPGPQYSSQWQSKWQLYKSVSWVISSGSSVVRFTPHPSRMSLGLLSGSIFNLVLGTLAYHKCCSHLSLTWETKRESLFPFFLPLHITVFPITLLLFIRWSDRYFWPSLAVYVPNEYSNST